MATTYILNVSFNGLGGQNVPSSVSNSISSNATSVTLTVYIPSTEPTLSGYEFLGWSDSIGATTATYSPNDSYTKTIKSSAPTQNVTLYAVWKSLGTVRIVNSNSGLDTYQIYIVNSSGTLDMYRAYIVNSSGTLDAYS